MESYNHIVLQICDILLVVEDTSLCSCIGAAQTTQFMLHTQKNLGGIHGLVIKSIEYVATAHINGVLKGKITRTKICPRQNRARRGEGIPPAGVRG